jgi:Na+/phosphate symporter
MIIILIPLLVAVCGVLLYALAANPKLSTIGLVLFAVGAFYSVAYAGSAFTSMGSGPPVGEHWRR